MSKLSYVLPERAKEIIEELAEQKLNESLFCHYMSFLLRHAGFFYASDAFYSRSKDETYSYDEINRFLAMRGVEVEAPKPDMPKIKFVDLKTTIKETLEMVIATTEMYNEVILELLNIDHLAYLELSGKMSSQRYRLESLQNQWTIFEKVGSYEDQKVQEVLYYAPSTEGAISATM